METLMGCCHGLAREHRPDTASASASMPIEHLLLQHILMFPQPR